MDLPFCLTELQEGKATVGESVIRLVMAPVLTKELSGWGGAVASVQH